MDSIRGFKISLPSLDEQRAMLDEIADESRQLNVTQSAAAREVSLLREYRTRLITDVVTGKLDVRERAEQLPYEVMESESPTDDSDVSDDESVEAIADSEDAVREALS